MARKIEKSEQEWREELTPEQYRIIREGGTERPFTGEYVEKTDEGIYQCVGCGNELFSSETKYKSGTGWPSFWSPASEKKVDLEADNSLGMERTEVVCSQCGAHLGHVFDDGPAPTHKRYCINSAALSFDAGPEDSD